MMLRRMSPDVALLRHARLSGECPFTGVDRKSPWSGQTDANDVVDDARSRHRMCQRVIVEQRITGGGRPHAG
jgi:hypothetical protein